ncbi:hypothetical protein [Micromonospora chersina]|uniref:hypothetical protein n=1 Tax=Micromonospora chersina TaxID=47854 RepID=UPI0033AAAC4F
MTDGSLGLAWRGIDMRNVGGWMDTLAIIKMRLEKANMPFTVRTLDAPSRDGKSRKDEYLVVDFPNGRNRRTLVVTRHTADLLNEVDFEDWVFLGEFAAILDRKTGQIEAILRSFGTPTIDALLKRLTATVEENQSDQSGVVEAEAAAKAASDESERPLRIKFPGISGRLEAEISPANHALAWLERGFGPRVGTFSLKLKAKGVNRHEDALVLLREFSTSLFFDLDVTHQTSFGLAVSWTVTQKRRDRERAKAVHTRAPRLPRMRYSPEAASLYTYGRSAAGMPLLEFLAYYQVMEFYFSVYSRQELMQRVRQELLDPRFDPNSDSDLARMMGILGGSSKSFLAESEQLRATLRRCVDNDVLAAFIKGSEEMEEFLTGKQEIAGVKPLNFSNKEQKIVDQVADRIYQIRCRIVHSKEDGGPDGAQLLLPFGDEARKLTHYISLARFLAQKVLIAGAKPASWI